MEKPSFHSKTLMRHEISSHVVIGVHDYLIEVGKCVAGMLGLLAGPSLVRYTGHSIMVELFCLSRSASQFIAGWWLCWYFSSCVASPRPSFHRELTFQ